MSDYIAYTPGDTPWLSLDYRTAARTALEDYRATRVKAPTKTKGFAMLQSMLHYLHANAIPRKRN